MTDLLKPCTKRTYTKHGAKLSLKRLKADGRWSGQWAYRCEKCSYWHLGHPTLQDRLKKLGMA